MNELCLLIDDKEGKNDRIVFWLDVDGRKISCLSKPLKVVPSRKVFHYKLVKDSLPAEANVLDDSSDGANIAVPAEISVESLQLQLLDQAKQPTEGNR